MNDAPISREEQGKLLRWVRAAVEAAARGDRPARIPEEEFSENMRAPHGVFVTLRKWGELRGCIGKMDFDQPLWQNALESAALSTLEDPRFPPVGHEELAELGIEISILNPPVDLPDPALFDVSKHGIIIQQGMRHALLLPKVAQEQGWDAATMLDAVSEKAGLPRDAWRDVLTQLQTFTAFEFGEKDL